MSWPVFSRLYSDTSRVISSFRIIIFKLRCNWNMTLVSDVPQKFTRYLYILQNDHKSLVNIHHHIITCFSCDKNLYSLSSFRMCNSFRIIVQFFTYSSGSQTSGFIWIWRDCSKGLLLGPTQIICISSELLGDADTTGPHLLKQWLSNLCMWQGATYVFIGNLRNNQNRKKHSVLRSRQLLNFSALALLYNGTLSLK